MTKAIRSSALFLGFALLGIMGVKLAMLLACWATAHTTLEGLFGVVAPLIIGPLIGAEGFFWFRILHGD